MNNNQFYAFCRDQRKKETDEFKREILKDMYDFVRENGTGRKLVNMYINERIKQETKANRPKWVEAFEWIRDVFDKPAPVQVPQGQGTLL